MNDEQKQELTMVLELLHTTIVKNHISMATDGNGNILFFDTAEYLDKKDVKKCNGLAVNVQDFVV